MREYKHPPNWEVTDSNAYGADDFFWYTRLASGDESGTQIIVVRKNVKRMFKLVDVSYALDLPPMVSAGSLLSLVVRITSRRCDYMAKSLRMDGTTESECIGHLYERI